jgi:hypothetical protein
MYLNINDSCFPIVQISEKKDKDKFISLFFVHAKFMKLGMHAPNVIPEELTK